MLSIEEKIWDLIDDDYRLYTDAQKAIKMVKPCQMCGWCCKDNNIFITIPEAIRILAYTKARMRKVFIFDKTVNHLRLKNVDGYCVFYDNGRCRIHKIKPFQCMTYPVIFHPIVLEEDFGDKLKVIFKEDFIEFRCGSPIADKCTYVVETKAFQEVASSRLTFLMKNYHLQIFLIKMNILDVFIKNMVKKYPIEKWLR